MVLIDSPVRRKGYGDQHSCMALFWMKFKRVVCFILLFCINAQGMVFFYSGKDLDCSKYIQFYCRDVLSFHFGQLETATLEACLLHKMLEVQIIPYPHPTPPHPHPPKKKHFYGPLLPIC